MTSPHPQIDPEFSALIPPLAPEELALLEANHLGFTGTKATERNAWRLDLIPTPMGSCYWIYSHADSLSGIETFCKKPTAISRLPVKEWSGFEFTAVPMAPIWEYPPAVTKAKNQQTNIYFIQSVIGGPVKIGHAINVPDRLRQHQTGSPFELRIVKVIEGVTRGLERKLHRQFSDLRLHGEWFSEEVLEVYGH